MNKDSLSTEEYRNIKSLSAELLASQPDKKVSQIMKEKFISEGRVKPKCVNVGCFGKVAHRDWKYWSFKTECGTCMKRRKDKQYVVEEGIKYVVDKKGRKTGVIIHKESYCENFDGHLGFMCPVSKNAWEHFLMCLDLDHVDGNHYNNDPANIRTYCKLCHGRKSIKNGDCNSNKPSARKIDEQNIIR